MPSFSPFNSVGVLSVVSVLSISLCAEYSILSPFSDNTSVFALPILSSDISCVIASPSDILPRESSESLVLLLSESLSAVPASFVFSHGSNVEA